MLSLFRGIGPFGLREMAVWGRRSKVTLTHMRGKYINKPKRQKNAFKENFTSMENPGQTGPFFFFKNN